MIETKTAGISTVPRPDVGQGTSGLQLKCLFPQEEGLPEGSKNLVHGEEPKA